MSVTSTAKIVIDTNSATQSLQKLQTQLKSTGDSFDKLKGAIAGLALGSFIKSAFDMADAMSDLADATELSIASVQGFSKAVAMSGGTTEGAAKSLLKFTENIGSAALGSADLQYAFSKVGVSLQDLATLDSQNLLNKTLSGLTKIGDVALRTKLQVDLLGKGFKGVTVGNVQSNFVAQTNASQAAADATKKAAEAVDKLNAEITKLKEQVLISLTPFIEKFNSLDVSKYEKLITILTQIGIAFGVFKIGQVALAVTSSTISGLGAQITAAGAGFSRVGEAVKTFGAGAGQAGETWSRFGYQMKAVWRDAASGELTLGKLAHTTVPILGTRLKYAGESFAAMGKGIISGAAAAVSGIASIGLSFLTLGLAIVALNETVKTITGFDFVDTWAKKLEKFTKESFPQVHKAIDDLGKKMGMATVEGKPQGPAAEAEAEKKAAEEAKKLWDEITARQAAKKAQIREVTDALTKQKLEISKITEEYRTSNEQSNARYALETGMIGMFSQERDIISMTNEKEIEYLKTKKQLQDKLNEAKADKTKSSLIPILTEEMKRLTVEYEKQAQAVEILVAARHREEAVNQLKLYGLQQEIQMQNSLQKVQDEIATMTMTEIERKYYDISAAARDSAKAAIEAEEARRGGEKLSTSEVEAYYAAANKGVNKLKDATKAAYEQSRTFETGWKKAMNSYVEETKNGAKQAQELFTKATQGMEDAIVNFAKTGKFEWKGFVASMLEELLRSQIKQLFANMMSSMSGSLGGLAAAFGTAGVNNQTSGNTGGGGSGGGILDAIGSLFGGGSSTKGTPVFVTNMPGSGIIGSSGSGITGGSGSALLDMFNGVVKSFPNSAAVGQTPNIFSGGSDGPNALLDAVNGLLGGGPSYPSSVPSTASGGGIGGGGGFFSGIADTFSSIGSSISSMFEGWFADGGSIGAGKFGIVGERGPELVRGPGTVMPLNGSGSAGASTTHVTYNINAVDAMSFKQMVAADPQFIYAVTMQGQKGMRA